MVELSIRAGQAVLGSESDGPVWIDIAAGRIAAIRLDPSPLPDVPILDASAATVAPGFIDVHTHGAVGVQAIDGRPTDIARMGRFYATRGVTGFLVAVGGDATSIDAGIRAVRTVMDDPPDDSAACLGIHLEGPFINPDQLGAFRAESVASPDPELLRRWFRLSGGTLRMITLAPELPGAGAVIDVAGELGVRCSAGHSAATDRQMESAVDRGVRHVTHLFNAMRPLRHREPGLIGVALTDPRVVTELIPDGIHVAPLVMRLMARAKGVFGIAVVTDSVGPTGLADGDYEFEEQHITVRAGAARLADGTLAGSTVTMDRAVQTFARSAGISWGEAAQSASAVPAAVLGLQDRKGRVTAGADADLIAVDQTGAVLWTMRAGTLIYRAA